MKGVCLLFLTIGAGAPVFFPYLPGSPALVSLAMYGCFLLCWFHFRPFAFLVLGAVIGCFNLQFLIDKQLPVDLEGQDLQLKVVVVGLPEVSEKSTRFEARIIEAGDLLESWNEKVRLSWYHAPELIPGQTWDLTVRLKRPRGFVNPKGFDYQAWLLAKNIFASGYVRKSNHQNIFLGPSSLSPDLIFEQARYFFVRKLFADKNLPTQGLLRALLLGDKSRISQDQWRTLQATGTIHLMAISGLHIGLLATIGFFVGKLLTRIFSSLGLSRYCLRLMAPGLSILLAIIYAGLAGFSIPTQRATIFIFFVNIAYVFGRKVNYFYLLALCSSIVVLLDPFALMSPGFYLSFVAVIVLFYGFLGRQAYRKNGLLSNWLTQSVKAQALLSVGLLFPLALLNLPVSPAGCIANMLAIPVVSIAVVPLLFLSALSAGIAPGMAGFFVSGADFVLSQLWRFLGIMESLAFSTVYLPPMEWFAIAVGIIAVIILLSPQFFKFFVPAGLVMVVCLLGADKKPQEFSVTVLDVGQGLAVYVESPEANLLYDTGARFSEVFDVGSRIITPYLKARGVNQLDYLIVSHGDNDHAGGVSGVLNSTRVNKVIGKGIVESSDLDLLKCEAGMELSRYDFSLEVLWPQSNPQMNGGHDQSENVTNNQSCVVLLRYQDSLILLAGDIEKDVESTLLDGGRLPENIDVLVAPHHGSRTSSSREFIAHLKPKVIIVSAGYKNRYHHPHKQVLQTYERVQAKVYRTDVDGAVAIKYVKDCELAVPCPAAKMRVSSERTAKRKPWYW